MEFNLKELSYGNLISTTFPGLFLAFEIILAFRLFTPFNGFDFICSINYTVSNILGVLIVVYIVATLLGIILDGIHHMVFYKRENRKDWGYEIYEVISNVEQLQIYRKVVFEDFWYYYECYANVAIAMIPGVFLIPYWLFLSNIKVWFIIVIIILYLVVLTVMFYQAVDTLEECFEIEKALTENFSTQKDRPLDHCHPE